MATTSAVSPASSDGVGEQAIDPGDHPWQRPAGEADGDEPGEGEGDGTGVVGPVAEQPEGDDDDGGFGGHRHAPADPLHAAPVLCPGLDVAGVGGVQTDRQGSEPEHDERPDEHVLPVGEQTRRRSQPRWRSRRAPCCGGSASPGGRRPARAAGAGRPPEAARQRSAGRRPRPARRTRRGPDGRASPPRACRPPRASAPPRTIGASRSRRRRNPRRRPAAAHRTTRIGRTISTADGPSASGDRQGDTGDDSGQRGAEEAVGGTQLGKRRRRAGRGRRSRTGTSRSRAITMVLLVDTNGGVATRALPLERRWCQPHRSLRSPATQRENSAARHTHPRRCCPPFGGGSGYRVQQNGNAGGSSVTRSAGLRPGSAAMFDGRARSREQGGSREARPARRRGAAG